MVYLSVLAYVVYRRTGLHYIAGPAFNFIFQPVATEDTVASGNEDRSDVGHAPPDEL